MSEKRGISIVCSRAFRRRSVSFADKPIRIFAVKTSQSFTSLLPKIYYDQTVTVETFRPEIADALKAYDKHVVALEKTPADFELSVISLITKAIKAYESRGPELRHGIALDKQVTVILSQSDTARPLCGI